MKPKILTNEEENEVRKLAQQYYESIRNKEITNTKRLCGIEIEFSIIDDTNQLQPNTSLQFSTLAPDHPIVPELGSYQIEINPDPVKIDTTTFSRIYGQVQKARCELEKIAQQHGKNIIPIGLPFYLDSEFLKKSDIITDKNRYLVSASYFGGLNKQGTRVDYQDGGHFFLPGDSGVTVINELHVQLQAINLHDLIKLFNYSQMITAPFVAIGANSGITNGKILENIEQQIDIFEKSEGVYDGIKGVPRVGLFPGYISEISDFMDIALSYKPLYIPDDKSASTAFELMLGIYYGWTRIRYGLEPTPHWRIEFRPLSSQPTMIENIALSEFYVKTLLSLINNNVQLLPQEYLVANFKEAIKHGMNSKIYWDLGQGLELYPAHLILSSLIDLLYPREYLDIIEKRIERKMAPSDKLIKETKKYGYELAIENYKSSFKNEKPYIH